MNIHTTTGRWKLGLFLSFITIIMWGVAPIAIKVILYDMDAATVAWYRFLLSAVIMGIWVNKKYGKPSVNAFKGSVLWLIIIASLSLSGNYAFFMLGLKYLPPSSTAVVIQLAPMFLLFGSLIIFKEKFSHLQSIGFIILVCGLILFFNRRFGEIIGGLNSYTMGIIFVILSALLWAIYALAQKQLLNTFPSETIMFIIYVISVLFFTPFARPYQLFNISVIQMLLLLFTGLNTILAYGCFSESLNHLEASRVSAILSITPLVTIVAMRIVALIFPSIIEPELLNTLSIIGAIMVVSGSMVSSLSRSNHNQG